MLSNLLSQVTRPIIGCFIIGLLIGGFTLGIVDANRPHPLFSSASPIDYFPIECVAPAQQAENYLTWANAQPRPIRPDIYAGWEQEYTNITDNLINCVHSICEPLNNALNEAAQAYSDAQQASFEANVELVRAENLALQAVNDWLDASQAYDDAHSEFINYRDSLIPPITPEQQSHLDYLEGVEGRALEASNAAEARVHELDALYQEAQDAVTEAQQAVVQASLANDQAYQAYHGRHCDSAMAYEPENLDPNEPSSYTPTGYQDPGGYNQPNPTPTPTGPRNSKSEEAGTLDSKLNGVIPKLPSSDKTRAY